MGRLTKIVNQVCCYFGPLLAPNFPHEPSLFLIFEKFASGWPERVSWAGFMTCYCRCNSTLNDLVRSAMVQAGQALVSFDTRRPQSLSVRPYFLKSCLSIAGNHANSNPRPMYISPWPGVTARASCVVEAWRAAGIDRAWHHSCPRSHRKL